VQTFKNPTEVGTTPEKVTPGTPPALIDQFTHHIFLVSGSGVVGALLSF